LEHCLEWRIQRLSSQQFSNFYEANGMSVFLFQIVLIVGGLRAPLEGFLV
jgi:hypothetical protein